MGLMKGDMGGAAVVCATMMAIANLKLPINVVGLTPLCENMPSGNAYKPGDVVTAMNGKTIEVCTLHVRCSILYAYYFFEVIDFVVVCKNFILKNNDYQDWLHA